MDAIITTVNKSIKGKSLKDIQSQMKGLLNTYGKRGLTALTDTGATIHVELYDGQDYIQLANGRVIR